jgi:hypothetical protein
VVVGGGGIGRLGGYDRKKNTEGVSKKMDTARGRNTMERKEKKVGGETASPTKKKAD